jgi:hypothetical protein
MMSKSQTQPLQTTNSEKTERASGAANPYRASVPISVYRELASELQATEAQLNALKAQNQQLLQHNQRLRQKAIELFVSAQQLQQLATSYNEQGKPLVTSSRPEAIEPKPTPQPVPAVSPEKNWVAEVEERPSRRPSQPQSSSEVSAWVLGTAVGLIILTALGLGFLAMRFAMSSNKR